MGRSQSSSVKQKSLNIRRDLEVLREPDFQLLLVRIGFAEITDYSCRYQWTLSARFHQKGSQNGCPLAHFGDESSIVMAMIWNGSPHSGWRIQPKGVLKFQSYVRPLQSLSLWSFGGSGKGWKKWMWEVGKIATARLEKCADWNKATNWNEEFFLPAYMVLTRRSRCLEA